MPKKTPSSSRTTKKAQRAASERAMLNAFEALLRRHGPKGVGVNAVLASAKVGKRLLYEYFGDLEGLASAWARTREDPLRLGARGPSLQQAIAALPPEKRIAEVLVDYATALRRHPWAGHVLLADMEGQQGLAHALRDIRLAIGKDHETLLLDNQAFAPGPTMSLALTLHAAANYLALRARFAPDYNGLDLGSDEGWDAAMAMMREAANLPGGPAEKAPESPRQPRMPPRKTARTRPRRS